MLWPVIEYLKSPELVVRLQQWFGIQYLDPIDHSDSTKKDSEDDGIGLCSISTNVYDNHLRPTTTVHHTRHIPNPSQPQDLSVSDSTSDEGFNEPKQHDSPSRYLITNRFWYYLFVLGTEMGDEIFYAATIPFWFWNVDGAVGRRVVLVWATVMYIGQGLKDIIKWPRPGWPVQRLQTKWGMEYGMPSTHAMVASSMPLSVVLYMIDRYQFSVAVGLAISTVWCSVICLSRIYLGMHSVLDIIAGLLLTVTIMIPLIPFVDAVDSVILSSRFSPIFLLAISILLIVYYPRSDKWTPTRGDTTMIVSVAMGIHIGAWCNYQLGYMQPASTAPPYMIIWPTYGMLGLSLLRTVLGLCGIIATRAIGKSISYGFVCILLGKDKNELRNSPNSLENRDKTIVELSYKYFTFGLIGVNIQYLLPNVFKMLNIHRPDFYTEI